MFVNMNATDHVFICVALPCIMQGYTDQSGVIDRFTASELPDTTRISVSVSDSDSDSDCKGGGELALPISGVVQYSIARSETT